MRMRGSGAGAVALSGLIGAVALGGCSKNHPKVEAELCKKAVASFAAGKNEALPYDKAMAVFARMKMDAETGIIHCKAASDGEAVKALEAVLAEIDRQKEAGEAQARTASEENAAAERAAANAKEEQEWPKTQEWIRNRLSEARDAIGEKDWPKADAKVAQATEAFERVTGTKVFGTASWTATKKEIDATRARIPASARPVPVADRAEQNGVRGKIPDDRHWKDGCNMRCRRATIERLHDPDSFECVSSTEPQVEGDYWTVVVNYRARNQLGAKVLSRSKCFIQGGNVTKIQ